MTLKDKGFRFVYRLGYGREFGCDYTWSHPAELQPTDVDCTDMSDDDFQLFVQSHG